MDNVVDDLIRIARKCEEAFQPFQTSPLKEINKRLLTACHEVGLSWCGSNLGDHACIYLDGFTKRQPGDFFDVEWGTIGSYSNRSSGDWIPTDYETVKAAILSRAKVKKVTPITDAATRAHKVFEEARQELLPTLDAVLSANDDNAIREQREKLATLVAYFSMDDLARSTVSKGLAASRDMSALLQGRQPPLHVWFQCWLSEQHSYGEQVGEIGKIAWHVARYMEQRLKMKASGIAKTDGPVYIGHGRSADWHQLKDFIHDRLKLEYEEFNRESPAGLTAKERLLAMLHKASFAFLVMTAEDEHADGKRHARENVIHEIGLFQGRLGFERAIILLEEGCEEFSNIFGVQEIRFVKGQLKAKADDIRAVLEREKIIK
jgi:predicted nucleotide-binding protein